MPEMKPCPFCGGDPVLKAVGDNKQYLVYFCSKCGKTPVGNGDARLSEVFAKKIWNKCVEKLRKVDNQ